jgi:uncharacterized surface protein with fasciclin (FAS1) repeats
MKMKIRDMSKLLVIPVAMITLSACSDDDPVGPEAQNVVEVAQSLNADNGEFSTLLAAVVRAGLADDLAGEGQRTVFAPTDAAFAEIGLNASNISTVPLNDLTAILLYHVAPGRLPASTVVASSQLTMASGGVASISLAGGGAFINDARIVTTDVEASNGIIHVIDAVLLP